MDPKQTACPECNKIVRSLVNQARKLRLRQCEIIIDHLPSKFLSPNSRVHWTVKHGEASAARSEAGWLAKSKWTGQDPILYAVIDYEFTVTVSRRRDEDNFISSCKPWQDGLVDAGVLAADDKDHLKIGSVSFYKGPRGSTKITITEIAEILKEGVIK